VKEFNNLLRPVFEYRAAAVSLGLAYTSYKLKALMLFLPSFGTALSQILLVGGVYYLYRGTRLSKYHRALKTSKVLVKDSSEIFRSNRSYFVGLGFDWTAEHAKRLKDLFERRNGKFINGTRTELRARDFLQKHSDNTLLEPLYNFTQSTHWLGTRLVYLRFMVSVCLKESARYCWIFQ